LAKGARICSVRVQRDARVSFGRAVRHTRQLRRSGVSIPANIAEGFVKRGVADKLRYFNIAQGSLEESRYYLILASDLGLGNLIGLERLLDECSRMIEAYSQTIRSSIA
jgi:four helix bundle protein